MKTLWPLLVYRFSFSSSSSECSSSRRVVLCTRFNRLRWSSCMLSCRGPKRASFSNSAPRRKSVKTSCRSPLACPPLLPARPWARTAPELVPVRERRATLERLGSPEFCSTPLADRPFASMVPKSPSSRSLGARGVPAASLASAEPPPTEPVALPRPPCSRTAGSTRATPPTEPRPPPPAPTPEDRCRPDPRGAALRPGAPAGRPGAAVCSAWSVLRAETAHSSLRRATSEAMGCLGGSLSSATARASR
mmetsp:Transcript_60687/g.188155  ORF Transcript_60687/g.188155 Transcript_60687/m.188155 type:complete len:249 (+) Transcript_60687:364-1110(+)